MPSSESLLTIELSAVIVSVTDGEPRVVLAKGPALPSGPLESRHEKLEQGLRAWVKSVTGLPLGYVEQLYTFADKDRGAGGQRVISIGYLALTRPLRENQRGAEEGATAFQESSVYRFFPWEDHRAGSPTPILSLIHKQLGKWKSAAPDRDARQERENRIAVTFPKDPRQWNEELVLQRYELLWEAGLIEESARAGLAVKGGVLVPGLAMTHDHRRILATALARLRAKIKYRPVVFELLPPYFTLLQLQNTVEALAGVRLHKQNFRRLVQGQGLVEETRQTSLPAKGRPAKLFAFRRDVLRERAVVGTKLPRG